MWRGALLSFPPLFFPLFPLIRRQDLRAVNSPELLLTKILTFCSLLDFARVALSPLSLFYFSIYDDSAAARGKTKRTVDCRLLRRGRKVGGCWRKEKFGGMAEGSGLLLLQDEQSQSGRSREGFNVRYGECGRKPCSVWQREVGANAGGGRLETLDGTGWDRWLVGWMEGERGREWEVDLFSSCELPFRKGKATRDLVGGGWEGLQTVSARRHPSKTRTDSQSQRG